MILLATLSLAYQTREGRSLDVTVYWGTDLHKFMLVPYVANYGAHFGQQLDFPQFSGLPKTVRK